MTARVFICFHFFKLQQGLGSGGALARYLKNVLHRLPRRGKTMFQPVSQENQASQIKMSFAPPGQGSSCYYILPGASPFGTNTNSLRLIQGKRK